MAYEMREGSGSLFKNRRKQKENHPDMQGKLMVGGEVRWVSAWRKKTESGDEWISFAIGDVVQPKQDGHSEAKSNGYQPAGKPMSQMDDDIPW